MKKVQKIVSFVLTFAMMMCIFANVSVYEVKAGSYNGTPMYNNGVFGVSIDIGSAPYTTVAARDGIGNGWGSGGCTWFVAGRVTQLTGKKVITQGAGYWWNTYAAKLGFSQGTTLDTANKSIIITDNHVAIIEKVYPDGSILISEGGANSEPSTNPAVAASNSVSMAPYNYTAIIKWKSLDEYLKWGSKKLKGYVYLGVPFEEGSSSTPTEPSSSIYLDHFYTIDSKVYETNAVVYGTCNKSASDWISQCGLYLGLTVDGMQKVKTEDVSSAANNRNSGTSFDIWYDITSEIGLVLTPGTHYYYSFYVICNGKEYRSTDYNHFTTKGTHVHTRSEAFIGHAATCEENGVKSYWQCCSDNCNKYFEVTVNSDNSYNYTTNELTSLATPATGHSYTAITTAKAATCTENGCTAGKKCKTCGKIAEASAVIPATGHSYTAITTAKAATCTENGCTAGKKCKTCGMVAEASVAIPATGHSFDSGVVTVTPTTTTEGVKTFTCSTCKATKTEAIEKLPAQTQNVDTSTLNCQWYISPSNGKSFWYEGGVRQGTYADKAGVLGDGTIRGREIYDPASNGWYWLDSIYDGAKAVNKEVWMPYIYQNEKSFGVAELYTNAALSGDMAEQVIECIRNGSGKWVRYDANGKMYKGWYTVTEQDAVYYPGQVGNTYYYDLQTGLAAKGYVTIDGKLYHFNEITAVLDK